MTDPKKTERQVAAATAKMERTLAGRYAVSAAMLNADAVFEAGETMMRPLLELGIHPDTMAKSNVQQLRAVENNATTRGLAMLPIQFALLAVAVERWTVTGLQDKVVDDLLRDAARVSTLRDLRHSVFHGWIVEQQLRANELFIEDGTVTWVKALQVALREALQRWHANLNAEMEHHLSTYGY